MNRALVLILLISTTLTSCWRKNFVTNEEGILLELPVNAVSRMEKSQAEFEYLNIKAKANYIANGNKQAFTLFLKMKKDSLLWASATGFGFEAIRAKITPDSVFVLDRLNKKYYTADLNLLSQLVGFEVTLPQLQNILIGNAPLANSSYTKATSSSYNDHLTSVEGLLSNILRLNADFRVNQSRLEQLSTSKVLDLRYMGHEKVKQVGQVPRDISANVQSTDSSSVDIILHYSSIDTDKFDNLPFSIPKNYEKGT